MGLNRFMLMGLVFRTFTRKLQHILRAGRGKPMHLHLVVFVAAFARGGLSQYHQ